VSRSWLAVVAGRHHDRRERGCREKTRLALVNGVNVAGKTESRATRAERESQRGAFRGRLFWSALARSRNEHDRVPRGQERGQETGRWCKARRRAGKKFSETKTWPLSGETNYRELPRARGRDLERFTRICKYWRQ